MSTATRSTTGPSRSATVGELATEAWTRIRALGHDPKWLAASRDIMAEVGLTLGPMKALRFVPLDEPIAMRQLAAKLGCDNSYVTALADALEDKGFARRETHPTDRRIKVIVLTEKGRQLAGRLQRLDAAAPEAFTDLSVGELETLCGLLRRLDRQGA